jgi:L-fuculose-phosphate aldolase
MKKAEKDLRQAIIDKCKFMNASGLNQGTSGNISARFEDRMLITPSATPYDAMEPEMLASLPLEGDYGAWDGPLKPSTEWRFHLDILRARPDAGAVVHAHPTFCTALAMTRKEIPAAHYMMAAFGGTTVRCAGYATFGTEALSKLAIEALEDRTACLLANHGSIAVGENLEKAMWRAVELETIARQYYYTLLIGGPVILSDADIADTAKSFGTYGVQDDHKKLAKPARKAAARKTPARKEPVKKEPVKKAPARKAPARKPRGGAKG